VVVAVSQNYNGMQLSGARPEQGQGSMLRLADSVFCQRVMRLEEYPGITAAAADAAVLHTNQHVCAVP